MIVCGPAVRNASLFRAGYSMEEAIECYESCGITELAVQVLPSARSVAWIWMSILLCAVLCSPEGPCEAGPLLGDVTSCWRVQF
jgi:hypothetical protein